MARKKNIENLSADELFEMARQREQEEQAQEREAVRAEVETMREKRRALIADHRKALAALDRKIAKLGGKTRRAGGRGRGDVSPVLLDIIKKHGPVSTKEIKAELDSRGVAVGNLAQSLSYLKRSGRISSPQRAVYKIA